MTNSSIWVLALGLVTACATDATDATPDTDDGDLGTAEQALTGVYPESITSTAATGGQSQLIASTAGVACFLTGVTGDLSANHGGGQVDAGLTYTPGFVLVRGGFIAPRWTIFADQAGSNPLKTWATCMTATGLTPEVTWRYDQGRMDIAPVTANRRCFFTHLRTSTETNDYYAVGYHGGFADVNDNVQIKNDGTSWYIEGTQSGTAWASARCIDVAEDLGTFWNFAGTGSQQSYPMVTNSGDRACFLTQLSGRVVGSDLTAGPHVEQLNGQLNFTAKDGNGGRMTCIR